jgi:hypothetical protein
LSPFHPSSPQALQLGSFPLGGWWGQNVGWRWAVLGGGLPGRAKAASILRRALTAGEGSSRLGVLSGLPPLSLLDMVHDRT